MRPIDFCTPKPFQLEHSCSVVSQRDDQARAMRFFRCALARGPPSSRSLATPCSFTQNVSFSRAASHVRRRALRAPVGSGPPDANEAGENRASRRGSHFGDRTILTRWRYLPPCEIEDRPPLTPLSPPPSLRVASLFFERPELVRRPPRSFPRGPRERRALHRSRVPSAGRHHAHPARAEARTKPRSLHRRRGAHVMRIAELP